ncbi:indole acetimide hydrolase [Polymorphobacter arshaanensis]|uniref:Indole acetimide hydrolase n=1 Tax=Glacieibacterium arshaanense TaxID=2511025 RepID=A0A4Y9EQC1_9SPHN|nr:amidase [Polymorphobacter arshaanensis]TFU05807.1 indole acetimide hydrolase [Polymorphobacter arshaanensis]
MGNELWRNSATELAAMIARRDTSSRAVVEAHLARIAAVNPAVNAVVSTDAAGALAAADAADKAVAAGAALGPFHGVPFSVKANIDQVGVPTTHGVPAFANAMPSLDDPTVERMKAAGGIPFARTNLPDMGLRIHTDSALYGLTRNPWDAGRTVGGSSGGEGAALATGMTPIGLGNDIGGSLRNPAFACGIASLKPSFGRIPYAQSIELRSPMLVFQMMAVYGPMARSVGDLRTALSVLAGPHPRDPFSFPAPLVGPKPAGRIKVAVVADPPGGTTAPEISAGVRAAAAALKDAGYDVVEVNPPMVEDAIDVWAKWLVWEYGTMTDVLRQIMSPDAVGFFEAFAATQPLPSYADGVMLQARRHEIARAWSEFFADYPLILGPTWCTPQFVHGYDVAGPESTANILNVMRFVVPMNLLGLPVVCVPTGTANGLPLGVQITGDRFREDLCVDAGAAIEARLGRLTPIDPKK